MEKLIFTRPKWKNLGAKDTVVIRIGGEAYNIIAAISAETGKSVSHIASRMIEFAKEHTVIEDDN